MIAFSRKATATPPQATEDENQPKRGSKAVGSAQRAEPNTGHCQSVSDNRRKASITSRSVARDQSRTATCRLVEMIWLNLVHVVADRRRSAGRCRGRGDGQSDACSAASHGAGAAAGAAAAAAFDPTHQAETDAAADSARRPRSVCSLLSSPAEHCSRLTREPAAPQSSSSSSRRPSGEREMQPQPRREKSDPRLQLEVRTKHARVKLQAVNAHEAPPQASSASPRPSRSTRSRHP